jgi:hypothetical protein
LIAVRAVAVIGEIGKDDLETLLEAAGDAPEIIPGAKQPV